MEGKAAQRIQQADMPLRSQTGHMGERLLSLVGSKERQCSMTLRGALAQFQRLGNEYWESRGENLSPPCLWEEQELLWMGVVGREGLGGIGHRGRQPKAKC